MVRLLEAWLLIFGKSSRQKNSEKEKSTSAGFM